MRLRLRGRFRTLTLVPWYEVAGEASIGRGSQSTIGLLELRGLAAEDPLLLVSLRELLAQLNPVLGGPTELDAVEVTARVHRLIEQGVIYVLAERYQPMTSEQPDIYVFEPDFYESERSFRAPTHWIEVELLDEAGEPVVGERCRIVLPDERVIEDRTNSDGLVRVSRIISGSCEIVFPDLDAGAVESLTQIGRQGTQAPKTASSTRRHWIEVELLDEAGHGIANERCEISLPDGKIVKRKTDRQGLVRVKHIADAGDCEIRFPDLDAGAVEALTSVGRQGIQTPRLVPPPTPKPHWIEVELLDEAGHGVANERCEITLPDGRVVAAKTDSRGVVRVARLAEAGDCEIRFPDLDAGAVEPLSALGRQGVQTPRSAPPPTPKPHWVEVELLDEAGRGVANERCEITLPKGRLIKAKTDARGVVRVSGIADPGDCEIRFPDLDAGAVEVLSAVSRAGSQVPRATPSPTPRPHWIEVELVGEDGLGVANERCEITLPDGKVLARKTDARGLVRVSGLVDPGDCEIRFPDLDSGAVAPLPSMSRTGSQSPRKTPPPTHKPHWIEVELVGEDGLGVANERCVITLPDGRKLTRRTDTKGLVRVARLADPGDCQISFPDLDAAVWAGPRPEMLPGRTKRDRTGT